MYKNYSDADLIRAYSTMMENSGKISKDLAQVIELRGGLKYFERKIDLLKKHPEEIARIIKEVQLLTSPETNLSFVRKLISSAYMSADDLDIFVQAVYNEKLNSLSDKKITQHSIIGSITGTLAGSIAGGLFWWGLLIIFHEPFFFLLPVVYLIGYFIIRKITKQSTKNPVVLIATFVCAVASVLLGQLFYFLFA